MSTAPMDLTDDEREVLNDVLELDPRQLRDALRDFAKRLSDARAALRGIRQWLSPTSGTCRKYRQAVSALFAVIDTAPASDAVSADCEVDSISSRMCEHGTKSCIIGHDDRIAAAYAECARIARNYVSLYSDFAGGCEDIATQIEASGKHAVKP